MNTKRPLDVGETFKYGGEINRRKEREKGLNRSGEVQSCGDLRGGYERWERGVQHCVVQAVGGTCGKDRLVTIKRFEQKTTGKGKKLLDKKNITLLTLRSHPGLSEEA